MKWNPDFDGYGHHGERDPSLVADAEALHRHLAEDHGNGSKGLNLNTLAEIHAWYHNDQYQPTWNHSHDPVGVE